MADEQVEDKLYGLLAEWIALRMRLGSDLTVKPQDYRRKVIDHYFMTPFENACSLMLKLGLYKRSKDYGAKKGYSVCQFHFAVPADKLAQKAVSNRNKGPSLQELLASFLELAGLHHGLLELKANKAFKVHRDRDEMFDLFAQLGYVRRQGAFCCWTPKIEEIMTDNYAFYERKGYVQKKPFC